MKKLILVILIAGSCLFAFSQQIIFNNVPFTQDKLVNAFTGLAQDHLGYIWLSSYRAGLYRYDGTEFINYEHIDSNSNSIAGDWAECICIDSLNFVWIGTFGEGLDRFDPVTNSFKHFRHDTKNESSLANDTVTALLVDHLGNLWVGNSDGLDLLNKKDGSFRHYPYKKDDAASLSCPHVRSIYEDHQGTLWVGCGSPFENDEQDPTLGGLNRLNREKGTFTRYLHDPRNPNSLAGNKVRALFEDSKGNFWVGTSGSGLHIMDRGKGTFTHYYYDSLHPENLSRAPLSKSLVDHVTFIGEDIKGGIWIGAYNNGINRYDPLTKKITHFGKVLNYNGDGFIRQDTASGFDEFRSWQALFTPDGMIWISTFNSPPGKQLFKASVNKKSVPFAASTRYGGSNTFYLESDSILWIGADSGLLRRNLISHSEKLFRHKKRNPLDKTESVINAVRVDKEKNIWSGTFGGGLIRLDSASGSFIDYINNKSIKSSLVNDSILCMFLDHQDDLWIGTVNGLDKMDKGNGQFTHYELKTTSNNIIGRSVNCIREDRDHVLWVATSEGLFRVDISNGHINPERIHGAAQSLCIDAKNNVWVGTDTNGTRTQFLYRFDRNNNKLVSYADPGSGRRIRDILDIMEDRNMNLWVTTRDAIYKINDKRDVLGKYGADYGVHQNAFGFGDNFVAVNGKLFFGDLDGYYSFFPEEMEDDSRPRLNFTSFQVNGNEVIPSGGGILKQQLWKTNEINLSYNQNIFSIEFIGINYQAIGEIKYLFKLEGYDNSWHKYGSDHRAYYYNVPPGKYTFLIKAFNAVGGSSDKSMLIIISPPWWRTWWAYALFGLTVVCTIWGFIFYRSQKLRNENKILEEKVTRRTNQLNQSLEELKSTQALLIQSEKMASLGELTAGIAHEIQNPLNFMNNFSEVNKELLMEMQDEMDKGNIDEVRSISNSVISNEEKISHHGKRADAIVKGMLQHSRSSTSVKEPTDINALTDEYLRLAFHGLRAKEKSFNATLNTDYDPNIGAVNLIPQDIGRVLLNLFNNAFYTVYEKKKQNPAGYEPTVSVSTGKTGNWVEIHVTDNGNGISQKVKDKIFQPFFTTKPTGQGTGLGLSLSYDIVKAHGGELTAESKEGEGAEFIIRVPMV
jgi:signal transduction histidine kinase/ligand-binding sensor domain-containing protein